MKESQKLFQSAVLGLKLLQAFGLIRSKATIFFPPTIVALLDCAGFLAGCRNRLAMSLRNPNLAQLHDNLLGSKSLLFHLLSPFQFNISSGSD